MTIFRRVALLFFLCALVMAAAARCADDQSGDEDAGWITLFDGKSLAGWKASENEQNWSVEDGAIAGQGSRSHLFYVGREFQNFHFKTDVMINKGGNSGIFFHSKLAGEGWPEAGYESQVNNTHTDKVKTGSLYYVVKIFESAAKDNEWWTQEIIVQGKRITMIVNGKVLYEYDEPEGVEGPHKLSQGLFAFQQHDPGSHVRFKNVKVKPLP